MGEMIGIHQQAGTIQAYLSMPQKAAGFKGGVIIVHEIWGLTEQIKRVADRLAEQGFLALAPDLYSTDKVNRRPSAEFEKELFSDDERVRYNAMPKLRAMIAPTQTPQFTLLALSKLESCFEYVYNQPLVHQRTGIIGFGLGGKFVFELALRESRLKGVVAFYGNAPKITAELRHIKCPILAFYGSKEQSLMDEVKDIMPHMQQAGVNFTPVVYKGIGHGFFNDANAFSYSQQAAEDAWRRLLSFLAERMTS
jgi:carboxymethylenebutenolidase